MTVAAMAKGGYRPGAGRPKGSRNRRKKLLEEGARVAATFGVTPLDYLLSVMRDETQHLDLRLFAAKAAAPFCHPRLAAVRVIADQAEMTHEQWVRRLQQELARRPQEAREEAPAVLLRRSERASGEGDGKFGAVAHLQGQGLNRNLR